MFKIELCVTKYNNMEQKSLMYQSPFKTLFSFESDHLSSIFNFCQNKEYDKNFRIEQKEDISEELLLWTRYHDKYIQNIGSQRFGNFFKHFEDLEPLIEQISVGDIVATKLQPKVGTCAKLKFSWSAPYLIISKKLNSCRLECLYTRKILIRNERLIKKLRLDYNFEQMLKKRQFVIRDNFFYPIQTLQNLSVQPEEIMNFQKETQDEKILRNRKRY